MTGSAVTMTSVNPRTDRYRQAEQALWDPYALHPIERIVELGSPSVRLRVLEVGAGAPLLFIHGTAGPGAWPSLLGELQGSRCLILDRPGWGMSSMVDYSRGNYGRVIADLLAGVLDGLGVDRAAVIGNSIGNVWALRLAEQHPSRVDKVVLLGGGPIVEDVPIPGIIRLIASPIGAIMVRLPDSRARMRTILHANGHGASFDAGRLDPFVDWRLALGRDTDSMRNERAMVRAIVRGRAYRPGVTFEDIELAAISTPTLVVYGTADPVGNEAVWRRVAGLLPHGRLEILDNAGHEPWFEDPARVATDIRRFLTGPQDPIESPE